MMLEEMGKLMAPPEFWKLPAEKLYLISNGCGPKGYGRAIPDTILGMCLTPA